MVSHDEMTQCWWQKITTVHRKAVDVINLHVQHPPCPFQISKQSYF